MSDVVFAALVGGTIGCVLAAPIGFAIGAIRGRTAWTRAKGPGWRVDHTTFITIDPVKLGEIVERKLHEKDGTW